MTTLTDISYSVKRRIITLSDMIERRQLALSEFISIHEFDLQGLKMKNEIDSMLKELEMLNQLRDYYDELNCYDEE